MFFFKQATLCGLMFFYALSFAQKQSKGGGDPKKTSNTGSITAVVIDSKTNEPFPYANLVIKNNNGKVITGGISGDDGRIFVRNIPYGAYLVEINFMGYEPVLKNIVLSAEKKVLNLGKIFLKEKLADLDEVLVVAENSTITQKIDRRVVNVGKDLTAVGTSASELLNNVPSVAVDPESGSLSLRGNDNVRVLVDGKPANVDTAILLRQIPSSAIKSIEIITNPSAKYNPEGMSGIINIILHKHSRKGFNGALTTGVTRGHHWRSNAALNANYKKGKVNYFVNYGYDKRKRDVWSYLKTFPSESERDFIATIDMDSHLLKTGVDVDFTDSFSLNLYTTQNFSNGDDHSNTVLKDKDGRELIHTDKAQGLKRNGGDYDLTAAYLFDEEGDQKIELSANYSQGASPQSAEYKDKVDVSDKLRNYTEEVENDRQRILVNLDYTYQIGDDSKLELGLEYRGDDTKNSNETTQGISSGKPEERSDDFFDFSRKIYSTYVNYNTRFGRFLAQMGLRFEDYNADATFRSEYETKTTTMPYKDNIFKIYPSAFITYELNDDNQIQIGYSLRVGRPSVRQINPIRRWSSPKRISIGNPDLDPEFTNSVELNYNRNLKKGSFNVGVFYRNVQASISRVSNTDRNEDEAIIATYANMNDNHRYGAECNMSYAVTPWWRANGSANLYVQNERGEVDGESLTVTNTRYDFRLNNNLRYNKNLRFQISGMYRGPSKSIQSDRNAIWRLDIGGSWTVLKEKGTINLRMNDIFKGFSFRFENEKPFRQKGGFDFESRTISLGFTYLFGEKSKKDRKRRSSEGFEGPDMM